MACMEMPSASVGTSVDSCEKLRAWAIVGGESGPRARPMEEGWARGLRDICDRDDVAFFFKQWGGARPKSGGRLLDGEEWNGFPTHCCDAKDAA